jgi:type II secretory pathway pseudopilin PulG
MFLTARPRAFRPADPRGGPRVAPRAGLTQIELLVVVAILIVLMAIIVPVFAKVRRSARSVSCLAQLHQVATAFQQYAADNDGRLPDPLAGDASWEAVLLRYLPSADVYRCPADEELKHLLGTSYDWRDTGDPTTTLAGGYLSDGRPDTVLVFDTLPNWHAEGRMNAAMVDGSTASMDATACITDLMTALRPAKGP